MSTPDPFDSPFFRQHAADFDKVERRFWGAFGIAAVLTITFWLLVIAGLVLGVIWLAGEVL